MVPISFCNILYIFIEYSDIDWRLSVAYVLGPCGLWTTAGFGGCVKFNNAALAQYSYNI